MYDEKGLIRVTKLRTKTRRIRLRKQTNAWPSAVTPKGFRRKITCARYCSVYHATEKYKMLNLNKHTKLNVNLKPTLEL